MNLFAQVWFWMILIAMIGLIVTIIILETKLSDTHTDVPYWVWIIFGISVSMFLISFVVYAIELSSSMQEVPEDGECYVREVTYHPLKIVSKQEQCPLPPKQECRPRCEPQCPLPPKQECRPRCEPQCPLPPKQECRPKCEPQCPLPVRECRPRCEPQYPPQRYVRAYPVHTEEFHNFERGGVINVVPSPYPVPYEREQIPINQGLMESPRARRMEEQIPPSQTSGVKILKDLSPQA